VCDQLPLAKFVCGINRHTEPEHLKRQWKKFSAPACVPGIPALFASGGMTGRGYVLKQVMLPLKTRALPFYHRRQHPQDS